MYELTLFYETCRNLPCLHELLKLQGHQDHRLFVSDHTVLAGYVSIVDMCVCCMYVCILLCCMYFVYNNIILDRLFKKKKKFNNKLDSNSDREAIRELAVLMSHYQGFVV